MKVLKLLLIISIVGFLIYKLYKNKNVVLSNGLAIIGVQSSIRGFRNNNPFNIRINALNRWQGKKPKAQNTDGVFEQFESMDYGIRAGKVLLRNYIRQGHNTIERILNRFAPASENHTSNYIKFVSEKAGKASDELVTANDIDALSYGIIWYENGRPIDKASIKGVTV